MFIMGCLFLLLAAVAGFAAHRLKGASIEIMKPGSGHHDSFLKGEDSPALVFQAEDGMRDAYVTGVQTCALPI